MASERAIDCNEPVADQLVVQASGRHGGGGRNGVAGDALRQGHGRPDIAFANETIASSPILVEQVAEAQVGDAGAADLAEPGEGAAIGDFADRRFDPRADALQRGAMMGEPRQTSLFRRRRQAWPSISA